MKRVDAAASMPSWWRYVDEGRTHQIDVRMLPTGEFLVHESAYGAPADAAERYESRRAFQAPWEASLYQWELEARLAAVGRYWRTVAGRRGWTPVQPKVNLPRLDMRPVLDELTSGNAEWHQFHERGSRREAVLIAVPDEGAADAAGPGRRFSLLQAQMTFPDAEQAILHVVHPRLHPVVLRSILAREHLARRDHLKLVTAKDFEVVHGEGWREALAYCYQATCHRIAEGRLGAPTTSAKAASPVLKGEALKLLTDPRLLALHRRYLTQGEEETLVPAGPVAIKRHISALRRHASVDQQHLLTLLEASLIVRYGLLDDAALIQADAAARLQRLAFYL